MSQQIYFNDPVMYLDNDDFDSEGNLNVKEIDTTKKPLFIMIQANFCGFCTMAKPHFQQFANENKDKAYFATIQGDEAHPEKMESIKMLMSRLDKIYPNFFGFPSYMVIYKNKKLNYENDRTKKALEEALISILKEETTPSLTEIVLPTTQ
jgi:thiol-disulfide isomerase/thioredoxin